MKRVLAVAALLLSCTASADELAIRQAVETKLDVRVEGIQATPLKDLFEVRVRGREGVQILYSDGEGNYFFDGNIIEVQGMRNLTEERLRKLSAIDFNKALPKDIAVKVQRGNGRRVIAMFSDPYCPYCRRFEQALQQLDDVTVYVYMYPIIRPENIDHSKAVWCSADRAKAWLELAARDTPRVPSAKPSCANPLDKVMELGRSLGVTATPTLFFANGERVAGGLQVAQLRAILDQVAAQQGKN